MLNKIWHFFLKHKIKFALVLLVFFLILLFWESINSFILLLANKEQVALFIESFGSFAPLAFIVAQILQVVFAPIPGEASGFLGGYLFGVFPGFFYSCIGLCIGSFINFALGRWLSYGFAKKLIPLEFKIKFDKLLERGGTLMLFILFVIPGFPKDYLCIFLGLSSISFKLFAVLSSIGRMPGTFILSLQGASLFNEDYGLFAIVLCISLLLMAGAFFYKKYL
ncbi:MAG: hypothetical protein B6I31_05370 [Desulfobacteraceae bacterium 4572_19]|nr:MAG: hypothetical protein B6I31_05370 [Desulfobacteraceae bacterium 4572_19]